MPGEAFKKAPLSVGDLLALLEQRGLIVDDRTAARHHLNHIGYYRFSGYCLPFQLGDGSPNHHRFKSGTTFGQIHDRYIFDRQLRLILMDAIERIEISVRSAMSNSVATSHGAHWYLNPALFESHFNHPAFIVEIKKQIGHAPADWRKRDVFIAHYYKKYNHPDTPPCWMIFEALSFGTVSFTFANLLYKEKASIAAAFGLKDFILSSWIHSLSYVRNLCAHHSRLWNRTFTITPVAAKALKADLTPNNRLYAQLVVMQALLRLIAPGNTWQSGIEQLLAAHPNIPLIKMGIPADWRTRAIWQ